MYYTVAKGEIDMKLLLIEDDKRLCEMLSVLFQKEQITLDYCDTIAQGAILLKKNDYDLLLLDRMLPDGDGISLITAIRKKDDPLPILVLTALGDTDDKVEGIEQGADDYVVKPFEFKELFARVKMLTRRITPAKASPLYHYADVTYDDKTHTITCHGTQTILSKKEAALFLELIRQPEVPVLREDLMEKIWGEALAIENGNLDNQVYFVRKQLSLVGSCIKVKVSRGVGYYIKAEK